MAGDWCRWRCLCTCGVLWVGGYGNTDALGGEFGNVELPKAPESSALAPKHTCRFRMSPQVGFVASLLSPRVPAGHSRPYGFESRHCPQTSNAPIAGGAHYHGGELGIRRVACGNAPRLRAARSARNRPLACCALTGSNPQCGPVATKKQVRFRTCPVDHGGELGIRTPDRITPILA